MSQGRDRPASTRLCFVAPALDGPVSGGTLYNRELCAALTERGCEVTFCSLGGGRQLEPLLAAADHVFVDTLYLDELPELTRCACRPLFLLTHYLPALVAAGHPVPKAQLGRNEARALQIARGFLVTSTFMREAIEPLVAPKQAIFVVPPGSRASLAPDREPAIGPVRALVIANVLPGKRILPLLQALSTILCENDQLELSIIGGLDADPEYAAHCTQLVLASPSLSERVTFRGAVSHDQVLSALADADVLLSASVMESYGMALADARVSGVPILACTGGYAAAHVDPSAGGQLVDGTTSLATACVALARDPEVLRQRRQCARRHAPPPRSWGLVGSELLFQLENAEK